MARWLAVVFSKEGDENDGYTHLRSGWQYSAYDWPKRLAIKFSSNGICRKLIKRRKTIGGMRKNGDFVRKKTPNKTSSSPRYNGLRL
jgi:hypothetical protein